jgi:hypothetical protein
MSVNSLVLSLRTMFNAQAAKGFQGRLWLKIDAHDFTATVGSGRMAVVPGLLGECDVELRGDPNALAAVIYGGLSLEEAMRGGSVALAGEKRVAQRFVRCFPLPERAPDMRGVG